MSMPTRFDVPAELTAAARWVLWRYETVNGRPTKVPYMVANPEVRASSTDPATWSTFDEATAVLPFSNCGGLGFVLGDGFAGGDLDACRDPETGELSRWAQGVLEKFSTYAEVSPSGMGVKLFTRGRIPYLPAHTIPINAEPINGKRPAIELYAADRYFCVTGQKLDGAPGVLRDGAAGWARALELLAERRSGNVAREVRRATGSTEIPTELQKALEDGRTKVGKLWRGRKSSGDTSRSGMDASLAATLGALGYDDAAVEAALRTYPHGQVSQTGNARQLGRLLGLAAQARAGEGGEEVEQAGEDITHDGLALDMGEEWPDARYVAGWGRWFFWADSRWAEDEMLVHMTRCRSYLRERAERIVARAAGQQDAIRKKAKQDAETLKHSTTVAQVVGLARSNEMQATDSETWDADRLCLGTPRPNRRRS